MPLRMSTLFLRTLRDDPAEAEVASHRLLVRAGYIRRAAPGIYSWLPLRLKVLAKVERDALMQVLDAEHPAYGWARNKGYGAAAHRAALLERGVTEHHRRSWKLGLPS